MTDPTIDAAGPTNRPRSDDYVGVVNNWHFLVDRDDYRTTRVVEFDPPELGDGEIRVRIDLFGFTANNVTYAAAGDMIGYWTFFPTPDLDDDINWGRVPVWGFAEVVESRTEMALNGNRLFGYFPMSTSLVMTPTRVSDAGLSDGSQHRSSLPAVYNRYVRCGADPGYDPGLEAEQAIYRPLFFTSFLIDDFLADHDFFGAATVILASASSKTAFGTAHLLQRRSGITVVGLTSSANLDFVEALGCYDQVLSYDEVAALPADTAVFVDMSGNASVVRSVHAHLEDHLAHSMLVGLTHWEDRDDASADPLPGPEQAFFFAPSQVEKRQADWGHGVLEERLAEAWSPFIDWVQQRVTLEHGEGPDAVGEVYHHMLEGSTAPNTAHVLHP